jgi:hypothetical protein
MVRHGLSSETHSRTLVRWERISGVHLAVDEVIRHRKTATPAEMEMDRIIGLHLALDEVIRHRKTATPAEMEMDRIIGLHLALDEAIHPPNTATPAKEAMALRPVHSGSVRTSRCQTGLNQTGRRWDATQTTVRCVCWRKLVRLLGVTPH